jgi:hypothetical protein
VDEDVVEHSQARIEHQRPHVAGDDLRQEPWQQYEHRDELQPRQGAVEGERADHAEGDLEDAGDADPQEGVARGKPEDVVRQHGAKMLQSHEPGSEFGTGEAHFVDAEAEPVEQRVDDDQGQQEDGRRQEGHDPEPAVGPSSD